MFNPIIASKNIKDEFISYISTTFSFSDKNLRSQFEKELNEHISNGPWLEINDAFKSGKSIEHLIQEGILSPLFRDLEKGKIQKKYKQSLPIDRPLYLHQENAIRAIVNGDNAIVSTGTGSGKTNCFLIPVLNELLREKESGTLGSGIRALFIYPMNALANDQMKNIRKILMHYPDITFGMYNGGTENNEEDAVNVYEAMFAGEEYEELKHRLPNELLSRDEMKRNPPNILFTNYAMLEHLLFRPKDDVLFSKSDFKFVVLDEAHVYTGATGIETSILLRRLRARITATKPTQFILTSATLGDGKADSDVIDFAYNLCGVNFKKENIIRSTRERFIPIENAMAYSKELLLELADESNKVCEILKKYNISCDDSAPESELLYDVIKSCNLYQRLRENVSKVTQLIDISHILNVDLETTMAFVSICTRAQKNGKPLIDARYHYFVRSLEGCYLALTSNPQVFLTRKKFYFEKNDQYTVFEIALCDDCGKFALVGKEESGHLVQTGKLDEKVDYYFRANEYNDEIDAEDEEENNKNEYYYVCKKCGAIAPSENMKRDICDCGRENYIKVLKAKNLSNGARCGNCRGVYKRFYLGNDAATSVLATALYEELPEITYEEVDNSSSNKVNNIFLKAVTNTKKKEKKKGRQFLVFSDSRQEAAKFACYLGKSYNEFLRRRGICQIVDEYRDTIIHSNFTISDFVNKLTALFSNKRSFAESNVDNSNLTSVSRENSWVAMLNELARFNSSTSLTSLGVLQLEYLGNTSEIIAAIADQYNVNEDIVKNLLNILSFEIVKAGAICCDSDTDINDDDRTYIFYTASQRFISKENIGKKTVSHWMPKSKDGSKTEYYKTSKLNYVMKFLNIDVQKAIEFLDMYFDYLTATTDNPYALVDKNKDGTYVLPAKYFRVRVAGDPNVNWYKCSKCGKVSQFHLDGKCIVLKCEEEVKKVLPVSLNNDNHFAKLYFTNRMTPLFIKEHTAQLSKKESAAYQEQFVKKEINALSCSTTFEMGVDVGDLETVFLRDVPPLPANYAQRAGRAGRSVNAAAYALTFAKLSSHDLSFFKEPDKMISGIIMPPLFKVDNEKIVRRHIYAIALSMYFADHPDQYYHNDSDKFINEKGYLDFISWLETKPKRLKDMIIASIPNIDNLHARLKIEDFGWLEYFIGEEGAFTLLLREYERNIAEFNALIKKFDKQGNDEGRDKASKCARKLRNYKNNKLIEFLARGNILPRYGFPVDTVELEQNTTASNLNKLRLSRDLQVAIAEYAPSSEVVADGKLYTSRYIKKSNLGKEKQEWHTAYIAVCNNKECQAVNYSVTPIEDAVHCVSCGEIINARDFHESIEPRSGFVTEREAKDVPLTKQEKNYKSEDYYIGNTESKTIGKSILKFNNITVTMESTTNDSLMVKSSNNFYVCPKCGFAYAEDETIPNDSNATKLMKKGHHSIKAEHKHESLFGPYDCDCLDLKKYTMHHTFNTDVVKISFGCDTSSYEKMVSVMFALLNAMSKYLNIERRDIKACLSLKMIDAKRHYSIIIYDAVPGGAGHTRRLVTKDGLMLYKIIQIALMNMEQCSCDPSCYNCLRSYENQKIHDKLDRNLAKEFLQALIGKVEIVTEKNK